MLEDTFSAHYGLATRKRVTRPPDFAISTGTFLLQVPQRGLSLKVYTAQW